MKKDIESITNATGILAKLHPKTYAFETEKYSQLNLPEGKHSGLIAQDIEEVLPEAVKDVVQPAQYDFNGKKMSEEVSFKAVNYSVLIPYLIQGFNEQQARIVELENEIQNTTLNSNENLIVENQTDVILKNENDPILGIASPNPNNGQVAIDYFIPSSITSQVEILFTDASGSLVQSVKINQNGNGRLNIDTHNLSAGNYQYTLLIDGLPFATRKMICR